MTAAAIRYDRELEQYRNLMLPPGTYEEGFRWSSLIGAVFIALLMVPGAMYMSLVAGFGVGPAAQWVTVILFLEVARRAHKNLSRPELFVLYYMAGAVMATPFAGLLWQQFFVSSQAAYASGLAELLPNWYAPKDPAVLERHSFMMVEWLPVIGLIVFGTIISRLNNMILGYGLFRIANDIERLPFPMAPIGAQGVMALAEQSQEERKTQEDSWRWRVFAIGGVLGLAFGILYIGLPTISGALLKRPIVLLPIPWSDWTVKTQDYLPAVAIGLDWNLANLVTGMVLPFYAMVGSFVALVLSMIANPLLYQANILQTWQPNQQTVTVLYNNNLDFYFSFSIGIFAAVALAGILSIVRNVQRRRAAACPTGGPALEQAEPVGASGRGDIKTWVVVATYLVTTIAYIVLSGFLIGWHNKYILHVMAVLVFMGFLYTPVVSYVTARLEGMAGQVMQLPMVREAAFILSGYRGGVDVWFLPVPMYDYGSMTVFYRQCQLTGTKFTSIWKAEIIAVPIVLIASIFFANFIWSLGPIPSAQYPYTEMMWDYQAANTCIMYSSTLGGFSRFEQAFNWKYLASGGVLGLAMFGVMGLLHLPVLFSYGMIRGLAGVLPHQVVPQFIGALLGRYYFERKLGLKWRQYVPVVAAGFHCGMGLITVLCVGVTFLAKAVIQLTY